MNKKYMAFSILGLFAVALVTAGLVSYLSNTTQVDVEVLSPLTLVTTDIEFPVFGGEVVKVCTTIKNNIGEDVYGTYKMVITNNLTNADCDDFDSMNVIIHDGSDVGEYTLAELNGVCSDNNEGVVTVNIPVMYLPNEGQSYTGLLEFKQNVEPAKYSMSSVVNIA